jgi:hypothetical protein
MLSGFGSNVTLSNSAFSNQSAVASFGIDTIHGGSVGSSLELQRHTTDVHGKKGQGPTLKDQNSLIRVRTVDAAAFLDGLGDATSRNIVLKYVWHRCTLLREKALSPALPYELPWTALPYELPWTALPYELPWNALPVYACDHRCAGWMWKGASTPSCGV